jgi:hypothetical protein
MPLAARRQAALLTARPASSTIGRPMHTLGRAALLLLIALALTAAGIPPALDEDRSVPGFCSPDCPLQQDAHSVALPAALARHARPADPAPERRDVAPAFSVPAAPASPDTPRAPPPA